MPCRNRASTKACIEPAKAQAIEPSREDRDGDAEDCLAPNRSDIQPLTGMKIASATRYEVTASFSATGDVPMSAAIAGSEVAMTVESICSMNSATARMSGVTRGMGQGPERVPGT